MKLLGGLHLSLIALALINMVPVLEVEQSWGILTIAVVAASLSLAHCHWSGGRRFSRWIIYIFILAAVVFLQYEMFVPQEEVTVHVVDLAHFIAFLCCCKFFELRTYRDAGVIALISFLLMVIGAIVTVSPYFGFVLIIDMTLGVGWLLAFHTKGEMDAVLARRRAALEAINIRIIDSSSERFEWPRHRSIRMTAACTIFLSIVAAAVFVGTPRTWEFGLFNRVSRLVATSVTGVNNVVQLTNNEVVEDESTIMRVRFRQNGRTITNDSFEPYLRGLTFDRYYEGQWRRRNSIAPKEVRAGPLSSPQPIFSNVTSAPSEQTIMQEIWLEESSDGLLFSMFPPTAFGSIDVKSVLLDRKDWALQAAPSTRKSSHYVVLSLIQPEDWFRQFPIAPRLPRDGWSQIPSRVQDLALQFREEPTDPAASSQQESIANGIRDHLALGEFEYTLKRGDSESDVEPIEDFLFKNKRGHCEYFASAMTLLCQAAGLRARLVGGYHGGEYNRVGQFYQFRKRDAHAWVEVYLPNRGWVLFDPTPPSVSRREPDASFWARLERFLDYLRFQWSTTIVSFDAENRESLASGFQDWFAKLTKSDGRRKTPMAMLASLLWGPEFLGIGERLIYWVVLILCAILAVLTLRVLWILSLMFRELLPYPRPQLAKAIRRTDAKFYDRLLLLLSHKGHTKDPHTTPREFAQSLARANIDFADLPEFTEWFYEIQYGQRNLTANRWERVKRFLQRLREDPSFGTG
ncbi:MAG: DUF3488 and transglutaminase-like domain-containing protein [Phycisphaerales bacterium]|nr:DUF3488 and transglutaminase-like domain-containing protein [Phycisphaerales bacterium]